MKAAEFLQRNRIHFQVPIASGSGWSRASDGGLEPFRGQADVLDLNRNGQADTAWFGRDVGYAEPALQLPLERIRAHLGQEEVLTQRDVSDLNLVDVKVHDGQARAEHPRSLRTLVAEHAPFEPEAEWAILLGPQPSFVVFSPGQARTPSTAS